MRRTPASSEKQLHWIGSSKRDFLDFPKPVQVDLGNALGIFQKKSPSGIRTAKRDVDLVAERLKTARKDHEEHYGKPKR